MDYIYGLDLSLSCTGIAIFEENGNLVKTLSVPTSPKDGEHGKRLKIIADKLLELKKQYPPNLIVLESGFSRHAASTQAIFKTHGISEYIFYDVKIIKFAPSTIKKIITGNGRSDKQQVQDFVLKKFPNIIFENMDQSDSVAIGLSYFIQETTMKL